MLLSSYIIKNTHILIFTTIALYNWAFGIDKHDSMIIMQWLLYVWNFNDDLNWLHFPASVCKK